MDGFYFSIFISIFSFLSSILPEIVIIDAGNPKAEEIVSFLDKR